MHDDIRAEFQWSLQQRGRPRVIHGEQRAVFLRHASDRSEVRNAQLWIRGRLRPNQPCGRAENGAQGIEIPQVDEIRGQAPTRQHVAHEVPGAVIQVGGQDDVVAGGE